MKVGDIVVPATSEDALQLAFGHRGRVDCNTQFQIRVVVQLGADFRGPTKGYIVQRVDDPEPTYPYVWNHSRFAAWSGAL